MSPLEARQKQIEMYRNMSGEQRLLIGLQLHEAACEIARAGIRARFPDADESLIEDKLRERLRLAYATRPKPVGGP